jgi:phospholipase C
MPHGARGTRAAALLALALSAAALAGGAASPTRKAPEREALLPIRHVFIVVLENQAYENTFGAASPAHYLKSLRQQGASVPNYYGISHMSLGNYLALISGQAPNPETNFDCEVYSDFVSTGTTPDGQEIGKGCVYPAHVRTIANQLEDAHLTWKAYLEDMGNDPARESVTCAHPPLGKPDNTEGATVRDQYATRHNPFVYFHAIIDTPACARQVVNLRELARDLRSAATTPNFAFIVPNLCHDGHDGGGSSHCVNGEPGGLVSADAFLRQLVPQITAAPAFRRDGLLVVTFDEADISDDYDSKATAHLADGAAAACCNEQPGPNIAAYDPSPGYKSPTGMNGPGLMGPGGGRIGAVMLSPFIRPGTVTTRAYNHYALLRSVEDLFALAHLGYAAQTGLQGFGADIYTRPPARPARP